MKKVLRKMQNKKTVWLGVGLLVVLLLGVWFVRRGEGVEVKNHPSTGTDIVAFGDSLVEGVGASSKEENFVSLLSQQLGQPIVNLGVSGDTTEAGLRRITEIDAYKPKVVLLLLSGNDRLRRIPEEQTLENLGKIITYMQDSGAVVVLLGVKGNVFTNSFGKKLEQLSRDYKTAYVPDVLDGLFGNSKYMSDPIHPNDLGYEKVAEKIYPVLQQYLN